jgi:hypothetical protein
VGVAPSSARNPTSLSSSLRRPGGDVRLGRRDCLRRGPAVWRLSFTWPDQRHCGRLAGRHRGMSKRRSPIRPGANWPTPASAEWDPRSASSDRGLWRVRATNAIGGRNRPLDQARASAAAVKGVGRRACRVGARGVRCGLQRFARRAVQRHLPADVTLARERTTSSPLLRGRRRPVPAALPLVSGRGFRSL